VLKFAVVLACLLVVLEFLLMAWVIPERLNRAAVIFKDFDTELLMLRVGPEMLTWIYVALAIVAGITPLWLRDRTAAIAIMLLFGFIGLISFVAAEESLHWALARVIQSVTQ
jgi:hypothetical protein